MILEIEILILNYFSEQNLFFFNRAQNETYLTWNDP